MKNNFLQEAYGGLTEARSKHYCLGLPRKWKVMTSTLLLLFTFAIGNVWAAEGDPVSFVPSAFATYSTARAIVSTNDANLGTIYYGAHSTPSTVTLADSKKSYRLRSSSIVINIPARSKIDVVYAGTTARNVFVGLYEVTDASAYLVWQRAAGYSGHVAAWLNANANTEKAADGVTTMYDYFRAKGVATSSGKISSNSSVYNDFLLQNDGAKITLGTNSSKFYTKVWETAAAVSIPDGSTPKKIEVNAGSSIPAGKYLLCVGDNGSNVGIKEIVITPVYQLTWDFDGGSTSAVAGDDYTAAGYYVKGASLTYPENSTMSKTSYIFTDWSSSATAMPASALTITAQWALAGSAYNVNIASMTNGSVVASPTSQAEDGTVTLTVTPDDGYLLSSLSVVGDVSGDEVTVTANQFTMPAEDVTVNATFSLAPTYTVTLNPAGGTIVDATGWTLNAGNYEKEVAEGTVLTLPTFTKTDRAFKTWRKAGPADVASPVTVDGDLSLTAIWTATIEQVIYSWEGGSPATEVGGTAVTKAQDGTDAETSDINVDAIGTNATYKSIKVQGKISSNAWSGNYIQITTDEAIKTGDKVKITACTTKGDTSKKGSAQIRVGTSATGTQIVSDGGTYNDIAVATDVPVPNTKTFTITAEGINTSTLSMTRQSSNTNCWVTKLQIIREVQVEEGDLLTVTLNYNDGVTPNATIQVASGQAVAQPANPTWAQHRFNEWQLAGSAYDFSSAVTTDITLVANWIQLYTITYAAGDGTATGDAPTQEDKAAGETFEVAANSFEVAGKVFDHWNDGTNDYDPSDTYTVGTNNVTLTAIWRTPSTMYVITKGAHEDGDFTIDPASQEAGEIVTLEATPDDGYLFGAWEVVKTEDASATGITVDANGQFTMPGYAVTVNATFVPDTRKKILYLTSASTEGDKLYAALKDDYRVTVAAPDAQTLTDYDLVVLHESISGNAANPTHSDKKQVILDIPTTTIPVLNTKSYFYTSARWNWGNAANGKQPKGVHVNNTAYCNITSHPLFAGLTPDANDSIIILSSINGDNKPMQPVTSFVSGKEGYSLANVPDGCAIHELTPAQRGVASGKYLLISIYNKDLANLNANGQKLFQNAAAYLLDGSASWTPVLAPTNAAVTATPSSAYAEGDNISLAVSATGTNASTTYTWYKGADLATAIASGAIQTAKTEAEGGKTFGITACAAADAGIYWCVISNGTDCEASASLEVTVTAASNITFESAHGTAPSATTGASYTLPELTASGWVHQGWTASIDVTVDEATVTAGTRIANGKVASFGADVKFTAVWAQEFQVSFNVQDHGTPIAPQDIVDGGKVTKPSPDPSESGYEFGGWYKESACTNAWDFDNDVVTEATELFAKWTVDPCPSPYSLSKVVLTSASDGTVTGYNGNEYAGEKVIGGLADDSKEADITGDATAEHGYKLNSGGNSIVFATLKKGEFQAGDRVTVGVIYQNTSRTVDESKDILTIYAGSDKEHTMEIATLTGVSDPGFYTYRLKAADITAINTAGYKGIGVFRASSNGENHSIYSVEIQGCRSFAVMHTLTFKNFDGTATIAAEPLEEGVYASTVAPAAPKITLKRFLGWAEAIDGTPVDLTSYTITEDKTLYAVYEDIVCPTKGTVFSMDVTDPAGTEYDGNNEFILEIGATYVGGKAYSGSKNATKRKGAIDANGEYSFAAAGDVTIKIEMECALHEGDTISFTTSTTRELKIQKVAGTDLVVTSEKKYVIPAESPLIGVYEFYLERGNSESTMKTINITRPAIYDVTFNMMGHGSSPIAAIEDVLDGHKIAAPSPDPTDADYRFGGWYKENTLENEWDFDNDVVTDNITLYAKWVDKSDATLKSLKYGTTEIALEAGVYTYAVNLSPLATDVPALTAVPSNPSATAVVTDAAALDGEGHATSTVLVTPEEGGSPQTYTVNFTKLHIYTELADVTETTSWDWNGVATDEVKINDVAVRGLILANYIDAPNFEKLEGQENARAYRSTTYPAYQGTYLRFHATKPGKLTLNVRNSSGSPKLYVNGGEVATLSGTRTDYNVIVPAGDVIITSTDGDMRIYNMTYKLLEELTPDYTRNVTEGRYGTICLPNGGIMVGAELFEIAYYGQTSEKIFFDNIPSGEMEAGIPYIFLPKAGVSQLGVFYTDAANALVGSRNGLIGSYTQETITPDDGNYILLNNQYCIVVSTEGDVYVGANRAYIHLADITPVEPALAPGRRRISMGVQGQNAATGMDELNASETPVKMLIDGQLFILRGEKMYNANGQLVK